MSGIYGKLLNFPQANVDKNGLLKTLPQLLSDTQLVVHL
ncbi:MAG: hypothetical protein ACI9XU_001700 [Arenicella sp.]|jgi:hypothetical protein